MEQAQPEEPPCTISTAAGYLHVARAVGAATWVQALEEPENSDPRDTFVAGRAARVLPGLLESLAREWGLPEAP